MVDTWIWLLDVCSMLLGLACLADSSRKWACMCIYTQVCMHTYVLPVLLYILHLISEIVFVGFFLVFPIPYFYVPSSESWLPKKSVFQLFNPYNTSKIVFLAFTHITVKNTLKRLQDCSSLPICILPKAKIHNYILCS